MAAEPNRPKTGMITFVTVLSLILLLISVLVLEGLFSVWQTRAQTRAGEGNISSQVDMYKKEQFSRLDDIEKFKSSVIQDARAGKTLAPPAPPAPPPGTPGKTEPSKTDTPAKTPAKTPEKQ